eukprot:7301598-Prymnesium_polylepis.2
MVSFVSVGEIHTAPGAERPRFVLKRTDVHSERTPVTVSTLASVLMLRRPSTRQRSRAQGVVSTNCTPGMYSKTMPR